ncbi:glycoside hydrolase family 3 C-terminal domain-containing protein [Streptomyces fuscigenes]|uniref:glycoside hydrolase family 3 C-terminal domain-containing protein n=1 Tax=Streptomyces fuscigenes TaxID=1528880 RepID=UPI001F46A87E|nr:glycoside hydrolase family 3 C-terminal domain-containing protein [Streptomyces fuscigenes]MCF3963102.1 glycoside hydrolase family 3 C-terminal domain-containing protein [Streptomyces fuscigenes]
MRRRRPHLGAVASGALLVAALAVPASAAAAPAHPESPASGSSAACPWLGSHAPVDDRVSQVLSKMTLDEEITMVHGAAGSAYTGYVPGDARLCIPALKMQDGPVGVRMNDTTQLPAAASVAASFDPSVASSYGAVIGAEDKAKGVDVDLGPTVNIVRDPRWGRAFESYSEDPYLTGQIGAADIEGIQSQGVMAQVKHWAVYNQETNRNTVTDNAVIDDRTVQEVYTAAFGTIVSQAKPSSAMCSYSSINGTYACENAYLNNILKNQFGFDGFITSDWGGTHSTAASANAGMDMQMPDDSYFGAALKTAVQDGKVDRSRVDDMVARIMREEFRFGLFDHPSADTPDAVASTAAHVAVAKKAAEDGAVLLKNSGNVLPLDGRKVKSIAVIGDGAGKDTMSAGGGSATVAGTGTVTPYDGIKARAGAGTTVAYAQGNVSANGQLPVVDSQYLTPPSGTGHGLQGDYYANKTLTGTPAATRTDAQVDFNWNGAAPADGVPGTDFSAKWTGTLTPPATGSYTFGLSSDDGSRLLIDGKQVIDNWRDQATHTETGTVTLTAGKPVSVEVDYYQGTGGDEVHLGWQQPGSDLQGQAADLAAKSDVAIVYANDFESEGSDLANIDLPGTQNALIEAVAQANPNTIVVLNTGSAVTMPWIDQVKGVFEAWYPGQESGNAIAALLYGDVNPSGRLPVTFPKSLDQVPASTAAQWPGVNGKVQYSEGLDVGYKYYDAKGETPLYPFGYGLSYTSYRFSNLHVDGSTLREGGKLRVTADVTDTGDRAGSEVAQLYLSDPKAAGEPADQLKGFVKVALKAHQTKQVSFDVTARDASYWNSDAQAWTLTPGAYTVHVGDSSRSLPLSGGFQVRTTSGPRYTKVTAPSLVTGGSAITVKTTFTNGSTQPVVAPTTKLSVPAGWHATARDAATHLAVLPGKSASTTWSVTVPADAKGGPARLAATTRYLGSPRTSSGDGSATVQVAYPDLASAATEVGVTDDAAPAAGDFGGAGYSYSAQALADAGIAPGGQVRTAEATFTWPGVAAGTADEVPAAGQAVALHGSGTRLAFLGAGTNGTQSGQATVTYTDGTTSAGTVTMADWYSNQAVDGSALVATTAHWNNPATDTLPHDHQVSLYASSVPLTAGKQVAYVTLPDNAALHLFAAAIG